MRHDADDHSGDYGDGNSYLTYDDAHHPTNNDHHNANNINGTPIRRQFAVHRWPNGRV